MQAQSGCLGLRCVRERIERDLEADHRVRAEQPRLVAERLEQLALGFRPGRGAIVDLVVLQEELEADRPEVGGGARAAYPRRGVQLDVVLGERPRREIPPG